MKKLLSAILVSVMLAAMFMIPANAAKDPFGTVVEIPYSKDEPNMDAAAPDASWGEKIIHVDKNSPNAGITQWVHNDDVLPKINQDLSFDLFACWTDEALYLCFVSPDTDMVGGDLYYTGDNVQIVIVPNIVDISYMNGVSTGWSQLSQYYEHDWLLSLYADDYSLDGCDQAIEEGEVLADVQNNQMVFKFKMKFTNLGFSKKEVIKNGQLFSFSMVRTDASSINGTSDCAGWLEWGDFYNKKKGWDETTDPYLYLPQAENKNTTTANTFKLVGKSGGEATPTTPTQPTTPTTPTEQPSSWAKEEVDAAIAAGLVPADLQKDYTKGISRANLSKCLSALLDKVYGKAPTKTDAKFNDTTDADVLKAANLGIINGYDAAGGTKDFKPNNTLKRSEMTAIINRVAKLCGKKVEGFDSEVKFTDTTSHWCNKELGWPVHNGIVKGTSATQFSPENTLTVEQTIMMIYRTYTALK